VAKTYYVECDGAIDEGKVEILEKGVDIGDSNDIGDSKPTLPAKVAILESTDNCYKMELTITEGRFHQVKRMVAAVGGEVTYLKRISFGTLTLDENLEKGKYRPLTPQEIDDLKQR
jgi:16S rRNA pseudouridine516 synthase